MPFAVIRCVALLTESLIIIGMTGNKIHKGEQYLLDEGLYVTKPVNLMVLLTPEERDVLDCIRHCSNIGTRYISNSLFRVMTRLHVKTIQRARDSLIEMRVIQKGLTCKAGTAYTIDYKVLCNVVKKLNLERNPIRRLEIADEFRGKGREINTQLIKEFRNTEFNSINIIKL